MRRTLSSLLLTLCALAQAAPSQASAPAGSRTVEMTYIAEVKGIPRDAERVDVWIPYPVSDEAQHVFDVRIESPYPVEVNYDREFGNGILYLNPEPGAKNFEVKMTFKVKRLEIRRGNLRDAEGVMTGDAGQYRRYLAPSRYAVINDSVRKMAGRIAEGKRGVVEKARAVYRFILEKMAYNKEVPGWGKGDVNRLCLLIGEGKEGTGNCTDFHSLFGSIMRSLGIPVVFEMGFPLTPGRSPIEDVKGGYHCWAKFYVPGAGWVPVDISEADKAPEKAEYYFGSICENRVRFSRGRDILLEPNQRGGRLNYFGPDPYIEVDGVPFDGFERRISYRDIQ